MSQETELHKPGLIVLFQTCWDYMKFYQELLVKAYLGYIAISGAVTAFWITHPDFQLAIWGLLLPIVIGIPIAGFCFFTLKQDWPRTNDKCIESILEDLGLEGYGGPSSESYTFILWLVGLTSLLISISCLVLLIIHPSL